MRKTAFLVTALAGAGLVATPAAAEARPKVSVSVGIGNGGYGYYGQPGYYGQRGHYDQRGYYGQQHFAYGKVRELQSRVGQMRQDIHYFGRTGAIDHREARNLDRQAYKLHQRIDRMSRRGLNRGEYRRAISGIRNLHRSIQRDLRDGSRYRNYGYGYQNDRYYRDDDRWDRDDRWGAADRDYDRRYQGRERGDWDD